MQRRNIDDTANLTDSIIQLCHKPNITRINKLVELLNPRTMELLERDELSKQRVLYNLLQLPEKHRSKDIRSIIEQLLTKFAYIEKMKEGYGPQAVDELCQNMFSTFEMCGRHLIKIGDPSDKLFIILKGEVMVLYPRAQCQIDRESLGREEHRGTSRLNQIVDQYEEKSPFKGLSIKMVENYQQLFNGVGVLMYQVENTIGKGQSFGQLGIIYDQRRMAHIVCRTDCLFATVQADKYLHMTSNKWQSGRIHSKLLFLERHFYHAIHELPMRQAQRFVYMFSPIEFKVNMQVISLHSPINGVFILVEGSIVIKRESASLESYATEVPELNFLMNSHKRHRNLQESRKLITGNWLGLTEIVTNNGICSQIFFQYEATAVTNCKLLYCPAGKLLQVLQQDSQLETELRSRAAQQLKILKENTNLMSIPLKDRKQRQGEIVNIPARYYINTGQSNNKQDKVLRSANKTANKWECDQTYQDIKRKHLPKNSCKRELRNSAGPINGGRVSSILKNRRDGGSYRKSANENNQSKDLSCMSMSNIKRILADPFNYY